MAAPAGWSTVARRWHVPPRAESGSMPPTRPGACPLSPAAHHIGVTDAPNAVVTGLGPYDEEVRRVRIHVHPVGGADGDEDLEVVVLDAGKVNVRHREISGVALGRRVRLDLQPAQKGGVLHSAHRRWRAWGGERGEGGLTPQGTRPASAPAATGAAGR